jgi:hypothetical protein
MPAAVVPFVDDVVTGAAVARIVPGTTIDVVPAVTPVQVITSAAASEGVGATSGVHMVTATTGIHPITTPRTADQIVAVVRLDHMTRMPYHDDVSVLRPVNDLRRVLGDEDGGAGSPARGGLPGRHVGGLSLGDGSGEERSQQH